ncbi:hypothetical protein [Halomicrococcus gelatinilyticus]|uniref:hypothetical protein n=1 Tax=Halomicrococcus gelatinilyticus TaxID=1702103 RepID=UPI002E1250EA
MTDVNDDEPTTDGDGTTPSGEPAADEEPATGDEPMADLVSEIEERRDRADASVDDAFTAVDVGEVDRDELWADLRGDDGTDRVSVRAAEDDADRDVHTVDKATCHGCPHLDDPPELRCTHEGTEILAVEDTEHFRVADCPVVAEETDLGFDADE